MLNLSSGLTKKLLFSFKHNFRVESFLHMLLKMITRVHAVHKTDPMLLAL